MTATTTDTTVSVPLAAEFTGEDGEPTEFLPAADLERLMGYIADRWTEMAFLHGLSVVCLWRGAGGKAGGAATLGKCQKPSGLLKHFAEADAVVWLAADHCRGMLLSQQQIEALLYHELSHIWIDEDGKLSIRAHDFSGFTGEITRYGLWLDDLRRMDKAIKQINLPGFETAAS